MRTTMTAIVFLAAVTATYAQGKDAFDVHCADVGLLQAKPVQTEVKITEAQRAKMNKHAEWHRGQLQAYEKELSGKKDAQPDQKRLATLFTQLKSRVAAELTAPQLKRLREISLQRVGMTALCDEVVAKKIGMSESQLKKMRETFAAGAKEFGTLEQETAAKVLKPYEGKQVKDKAEAEKMQKEVQVKLAAAGKQIAPKLATIRSSYDKRMRAILTSKQTQAYQALLGKPFKAS